MKQKFLLLETIKKKEENHTLPRRVMIDRQLIVLELPITMFFETFLEKMIFLGNWIDRVVRIDFICVVTKLVTVMLYFSVL